MSSLATFDDGISDVYKSGYVELMGEKVLKPTGIYVRGMGFLDLRTAANLRNNLDAAIERARQIQETN